MLNYMKSGKQQHQQMHTMCCLQPKFNLAHHVTSQHIRSVECVEQCCSTSLTQPKCMGSTRRTCQEVKSQVEFGLMLLISKTWQLLVRKLLAKLRTDVNELRSICITTSRSSLTPVFRCMSAAAARPRSIDRHAMYTLPPKTRQMPQSP